MVQANQQQFSTKMQSVKMLKFLHMFSYLAFIQRSKRILAVANGIGPLTLTSLVQADRPLS